MSKMDPDWTLSRQWVQPFREKSIRYKNIKNINNINDINNSYNINIIYNAKNMLCTDEMEGRSIQIGIISIEHSKRLFRTTKFVKIVGLTWKWQRAWQRAYNQNDITCMRENVHTYVRARSQSHYFLVPSTNTDRILSNATMTYSTAQHESTAFQNHGIASEIDNQYNTFLHIFVILNCGHTCWAVLCIVISSTIKQFLQCNFITTISHRFIT